MNEYSNCCQSEKIKKNIDEENNINININGTMKEINSLKNNKTNSKRSTLFKAKSKTKIKSSQNIYSNTTNTNTNNTKKSNKSSVNNTYSINNDNSSNINNIINGNNNDKKYYINNKYKLKENEQINVYIETNSNNTNSFSKVNNKELFYETVDDNCYNDKNFNNKDINSFKKNNENKIKELDTIKSLNNLKYIQRNINKNDNAIIDNYCLENKTYKSTGNIAYQTYSGPFRKNIIKVNMIEKDKYLKNENINIINGNIKEENEFMNLNHQNKVYKKNISNSSKKTEKKNSNIQFDYKENKKFKKNNTNIINKNNGKNKNNLKNSENLIENCYQEKESKNILETKNENENEEIENNKKEGDKNNDNPKEKNLYSNFFISNYYKLNKNSSLRDITSNLNMKVLPFNGDTNTAYIKKNSSNINLHNEYCNIVSASNRPSVFKNKKNYSISQSCYNSQRNSKDTKINLKNKNNNKSYYLNSTRKNKNENKTLFVSEYKMKLESIKSRITNLLNVYSLLALKNINISKGNLRNENEFEEDRGTEKY